MAWELNPANGTIVFECDSSGEVATCEMAKIRGTCNGVSPHDTDFGLCWRYLKGLGWVSFKRTGKPWTYHCPKCAVDAEREHHEWTHNDHERERLKKRNAER